MKALVTGAAGFIGSHLVEALIKKDHEVTCLVRKTSDLKWLEPLNVKYIFCDLSAPETYSNEIAGFDYIFHLAGLTKAVSEKEFFIANSENTKKLLHAVEDRTPNLKRFVFLSSLAAIGPSSDGSPVKEDLLPAPVSNYGKSKLEAEKAVMEYKSRIPFTIIRPPGVYGPRDKDFFLLFQAIKKGFFPYWGKCFYSLLYVDDLVQGIILSAEKKEAEGRAFFLSDNVVHTNEEIAEEISLALNTKAIKLILPRSIMPFLAFIGQKINKKGIINVDRINDFQYSNWTCDVSRAQQELGFSSKTTLREGIKWTADWYKIHQWI